jgi:hypothetical protein
LIEFHIYNCFLQKGHTSVINEITLKSLNSYDCEVITCGSDGFILSLNPIEHEIKYRKYIQGIDITSLEFTKLSKNEVFIGTNDGTYVFGFYSFSSPFLF